MNDGKGPSALMLYSRALAQAGIPSRFLNGSESCVEGMMHGLPPVANEDKIGLVLA